MVSRRQHLEHWPRKGLLFPSRSRDLSCVQESKCIADNRERREMVRRKQVRASTVAIQVVLALLLDLLLGSVEGATSTERLPWQAMDYGPYLTASIEAPEPRTNIAYKGIAINFGANFGGNHNEAVIFDTDLL